MPWAELLKKVFAIDVLDCPKCSGRMKLIAFITGQGLARQIGVLKHRAYGFHSALALIAMIFLCCTKLPLTLPI